MKNFGNEIQKLANEKWKWIPGTNKRFLISNKGRVLSTPKSTYPWYHLLSIKKKVNGYPTIGIWYMGKRKFWGLHRWVLFAFKGPSKDGRIGMHKDGNKENNKLSNLKYATYAENNEDRFKKYPDLGFRCTAHLHK